MTPVPVAELHRAYVNQLTDCDLRGTPNDYVIDPTWLDEITCQSRWDPTHTTYNITGNTWGQR